MRGIGLTSSLNRKSREEWTTEVLIVQNISEILSDASVWKSVDIYFDISITRSHANLELLISVGG